RRIHHRQRRDAWRRHHRKPLLPQRHPTGGCADRHGLAYASRAGGPLGAIGGLKVTVIDERRFSFIENDRSYVAVVGDKVIVKITGNPDTPDPTLKSFIGLMDFPAVERLGH